MSVNVAFAAGDVDYIAKLNTMVAQTNTELAVSAAASTADKVAAQAAKTQAETARDAAIAAQSAVEAAGSNPPIRINTAYIKQNVTIESSYNGASAGPVEITEGFRVTISDDATWSIV